MKIAVVFEPDPELGPDPRDETGRTPRRIGEFIDSAKADVLLIWREYGEQFEGGSRTHVIPSGAWENVTGGQVDEILEQLGSLP